MDSGKIDVSGSHTSLVIDAPADHLITGYCVKAGSANQGYGPEYVTVDPAAESVTITHSSGKDISHYAVSYTEVVVEYTGEATVSGDLAICTVDNVDVTIEYSSGLVTETSTESQEAADAAAQAAAEAAADADLSGQLAGYPGYTEGVCEAVEPYTAEAEASGSLAICTVDNVDVTIEYAGSGTGESTESQEAADAAAQAAAEAAAAADLAGQLEQYPDFTEGTCPVTPTPEPTPEPTTPPVTPPTTPAEPETVAPVLPATVEEPVEPETVAPVLPATVEEPETVSVPLPATVAVPATVPAGDGSSTAQVPSGAVALMAAGLVGVGASTALLLRRRMWTAGDSR